MVTKKTDRKTRMFIQLGKRYTNGKIAKNEQYSISKFLDIVFEKLKEIQNKKEVEITFLDKMLKTKKYLENERIKNRLDCLESMKESMKDIIILEIEKDNYGKKPNKK